MATFELQGHRGARGLKPENTLPSFEAALDAGVTSIETDVHLTRDGVPVLFHDEVISSRLCRLGRGLAAPDPTAGPFVSSLTLAELRCYLADRNPDRKRFPGQDRRFTAMANWWGFAYGVSAYSPPALDGLFRFAKEYAGEPGNAFKTAEQRERAARVIFDLELKRVAYHPEYIGDEFDGKSPGLLEQRVVEMVRKAGVVARTRVRSFDHRSLRAIRQLEPGLSTAVDIAGTAPADPVELTRSAGADMYSPDYHFLDPAQVRQCHAAGIRVMPWTVNDEADWLRLIDWGVDGITTDYPDRLAKVLRGRGIDY